MLDKTGEFPLDFDFSDDPELAWTLPAYTYFDRDWFDQEQHTIFSSSWRFMGHVGDIPSPGDYLTTVIGDQPVMLLRDHDGNVRAFHNVCKHRAHLLLTQAAGSLSSPRITCPYHAWTYDLGGQLKAAPHCELIREFDKSAVRLDALTVEIVHGLVFVNLDSGAQLLGPQIDSPLQRFTETRWDLEAVITVPLLFMEVDWEMKREVTLWQTEINNLPENPRIEELSWHHTGLAELDEVLDVSVASDEHFILKSNIYQEINAPVGNPPKLNITQEVKSLNVLDADPPTAIFATPECTAITKEQLREQANDLIWLLYGKQIQ